MNLLNIFPEERFMMDLKARDKKSAFKEMIQYLQEISVITEDEGKKLEKAVNKRESEGTTGIGKGLAIPHAKNCNFISDMVTVYARSKEGVNFNAVDGGLAHLVFFVASPNELSDKHLQIMKKIATLHRDDKTLKFLKQTDRVKSVSEILKEIDDNFK